MGKKPVPFYGEVVLFALRQEGSHLTYPAAR